MFCFFFKDGGKEAMSKWVMKKQQKNKTTDSPATNGVAVGQKTSNETNNRASNGRKPKPTDNRNNQTGSDSKNNINDLVSSIINQYTAVTAESKEPIAKPVVAAKLNGDNPLHSHQQNLLNSLNNLIISSNSGNASKSIGGLKVTVIGIEQPGKQVELQQQQQASSVGASPASASPSSSGSVLSSSSSLIKQAPQLLQRPQPALNIPNIDLAYVNPNNSKSSMDKFQKDLHRQTTVLAKISAQLHEELHKSQLNCNQTFERLRHLLNERQSQVQAEFGLMARNASQMLSSRQNKAVQLKLLADNAVHLNDNDTLELKADIKHFVSERQLDEEFLKHRLFQADEADKICESLKTLGTVAHLDIQYATNRPSAEELFKNSFSSTASPPSQTKTVSEEKPVGNKFSVKITDVNGFEDYGEAANNEGEFIEVKKPRKFYIQTIFYILSLLY